MRQLVPFQSTLGLAVDPEITERRRSLGAIGRRERMVVMTGEPGAGKTTLCRAVIDQLDRRTLSSHVTDRFVSTDDLLKTVLADFGVISREDIPRGALTNASHIATPARGATRLKRWPLLNLNGPLPND